MFHARHLRRCTSPEQGVGMKLEDALLFERLSDKVFVCLIVSKISLKFFLNYRILEIMSLNLNFFERI